jgi:threonine/homoserine efflux transporter RhtA
MTTKQRRISGILMFVGALLLFLTEDNSKSYKKWVWIVVMLFGLISLIPRRKQNEAGKNNIKEETEQ